MGQNCCKEEIVHARDCICIKHCKHCYREFLTNTVPKSQLHTECVPLYDKWLARMLAGKYH